MENQVGCLARGEDGAWTVAREVSWSDLPPRIEGVIGERIGRLENELREILTVASVGAGTSDFLAQIVAQIQNVDERRLLKLLSSDLTKRHGLVVESAVQRRGRRVLARSAFFSGAAASVFCIKDASGCCATVGACELLYSYVEKGADVPHTEFVSYQTRHD